MRAAIEKKFQREKIAPTQRTMDRIGAGSKARAGKKPLSLLRRKSVQGGGMPLMAGNFQDKDEIQLSISCQKLMNGAVPKMHTFCVIYTAKTEGIKEGQKAYPDSGSVKTDEGRDETDDLASQRDRDKLPKGCMELGRTEVQKTPDPIFESAVATTFSVYKLRDVVVALYWKLDQNLEDLSKHRLLGYARFGLHRLVSSEGACESDPLKAGGRISVSARPTHSQCQNLRFRLAARLSDNKPRHRQNSFVVVSYLKNVKAAHRRGNAVVKGPKDVSALKWEVIWKSEVVRGSNKPVFDYGQFPINKMNDSEDTPLCITFMDYDDKYGYHTVIGQVKTTYQQMLHSVGFAITHHQKKSGFLAIDDIGVVDVPRLSHYLSVGGCAIDFMVAIDFTNNNVPVVENEEGNHVENDEKQIRTFVLNSDPSLHYLREDGKMNVYQFVLGSVGRIFQEFSKTKSFHLWGFGGATSREGAAKHRLRMGHDGSGVKGVEGLLEAYAETVRSGVILSSPKDLRKTLYTAIARAELNASSSLCYSVLLIVCCEGFIHELNETMEQICEASYEPISIIFVGVGRGNFSDFVDMQKEQKISPSGKPFMRECIHFVQLEEHKHDLANFTRRVLEELPRQVVQYHLSKNILPGREVRDEGSGVDETSVHPHLIAECVDMTDVSAFISSLSYDSFDI